MESFMLLKDRWAAKYEKKNIALRQILKTFVKTKKNKIIHIYIYVYKDWRLIPKKKEEKKDFILSWAKNKWIKALQKIKVNS